MQLALDAICRQEPAGGSRGRQLKAVTILILQQAAEDCHNFEILCCLRHCLLLAIKPLLVCLSWAKPKGCSRDALLVGNAGHPHAGSQRLAL